MTQELDQDRSVLRSEIATLAPRLRYMCEVVHIANRKWWRDIHTDVPLQRNVGEMLMLCVSELAEALEAHRKGLMDDKLPTRQGLEVELADCLIRIMDMGAGLGLDLAGAWREKMLFNLTRPDHQPEARKQLGGKAY